MVVKKPKSRKMSKDNIDLLFSQGLDIEGRAIWLGNAIQDETEESGIDHNLMERFVRSLSILNKGANKSLITVYLHSVGGDEASGLGIYDSIKASKSPVDIVVIGKAYSMGMVILQAARTRILMPNASLMCHIGSQSESGHKTNVKRWVEFSVRMDKRMDDFCYARVKASNPSMSRAAYDKLNEFDTILMAEEAIELGFADRLFDPKKDNL